MKNDITAIIDELNTVVEDYDKALQGNKSAALRVKRVLLDTKKNCHALRGFLTPTVNAVKNER
jgi:hypothetical protein